MENDNLIYINSNIDLDIKTILNFDKIMTSKNLYKKNSKINIEDLTVYERWTREVLKEICRFFKYLISKIFFIDYMLIHNLKCGLKLFQRLKIYYIFAIEVLSLSGNILANIMSFEKIKYLLLYI